MKKKVLIAIAIMTAMLIPGCGNKINEEAGLVSTLDEEMNEDYTNIMNMFETMGISGNFYEKKVSESTQDTSGAIQRGTDYYVMAVTNGGDIYYGAVIDGEVNVWEDGAPAQTLDSEKEYDGNVVVRANVIDGYDGSITADIVSFPQYGGDIDHAEATLTSENGYECAVNITNGRLSLYDYTFEKDGDKYLLQTYDEGKASDETSIYVLTMEKMETASEETAE